MELVAASAGTTITSADEEAALGAVALQLPSRARSYPFEEARFDFWPVQTPSAGTFVLGVDFGVGRTMAVPPTRSGLLKSSEPTLAAVGNAR